MSTSTSRSWRRLANINAACLGACPSIRFAGVAASQMGYSDRLLGLSGGDTVGPGQARAQLFETLALPADIVADESSTHLVLTQAAAGAVEFLAHAGETRLQLAQIFVSAHEAKVQLTHVPAYEISKAERDQEQKGDGEQERVLSHITYHYVVSLCISTGPPISAGP